MFKPPVRPRKGSHRYQVFSAKHADPGQVADIAGTLYRCHKVYMVIASAKPGGTEKPQLYHSGNIWVRMHDHPEKNVRPGAHRKQRQAIRAAQGLVCVDTPQGTITVDGAGNRLS